MRAVWGMAALLLGAFAAGRATAGQDERRWYQYDGREWAGFGPHEKEAFVAGFLAGSAVADAEHTPGRDSAAVHHLVDSLYRAGGLRYPFGHMVYVSQLDEFYWWENHVPVPLFAALRDLNGRLKGQEQ